MQFSHLLVYFQDLNEEGTRARIKAFSSLSTRQMPNMTGFFLVYLSCECLAICIFGTLSYNCAELILPKLKTHGMDITKIFPLLPKDGYCKITYQSPAKAPIIRNVLCSIRHNYLHNQICLIFLIYYFTGSIWIIGHWIWLITTFFFQCARR